jgi:hypothetical protein
MTRPTLAILLALALGSAAPAADKLPPDLALVPGDAVAFVHVKVAEVWKAEVFADARAIFEKAGPKALAALDSQFVPAPTTIDRATLVVLPGAKEGPPVLAVVLAFSKPFDAKAVVKANMPKAEEKKANGKGYFTDAATGLAVHFADDSTLVVSGPEGMPQFLEAAGKGEGKLAGAVADAVKSHLTAAILNPKQFPVPPEYLNALPEEARAVLLAERLTLTMNFARDTTMALSATYPTADDAKAAEKGLRAAMDKGRKSLEEMKASAEKAVFGSGGKGDKVRPLTDLPGVVGGLGQLGLLNSYDAFLADPPLSVADRALTANFTLPAWANTLLSTSAAYGAFMLPAVQSTREAAARMQSSNNLKQIALAMHNYESANGQLPAAAVCDKKGKKLLSWRVAVLPYIEQDNLYRQFKLDEPWDSEHNKTLIEKMPKTYADPRVEGKPGETYYKVFVGKNAGFDWEKGRTLVGIADGTTNTIMVAAGGDPVTWTRPDDFEFDPTDEKAKLPDLSRPFDLLLVVMFDTSVKSLGLRTLKDADKKLRASIGPADGIPVFLDDK